MFMIKLRHFILFGRDPGSKRTNIIKQQQQILTANPKHDGIFINECLSMGFSRYLVLIAIAH